MDEKIEKEKLKDAQLFWHLKHQRMALNLAVSALMLGPQPPTPGENHAKYLERYIPLAEAIDNYIRDTETAAPAPWW